MQKVTEVGGRTGGFLGRKASGVPGTAGTSEQSREARPPRDAAVRSGVRTPRSDDPQRVKRLAAITAASVVFALVVAVVGVGSLLSSQAALEEARAGVQPTLVAAVDIRAGSELTADQFEQKDIPQSARASAVLTPDVLTGEGSPVGKRALVDIPAGTQMSASLFSGTAGSGYLAAALDYGMQAVTVAVDAETGLAGQLRPGDRVRVVALEGASIGEALLTSLAEGIRVVALDGQMTGGAEVYSSVTLEVSPQQADAIREAQYAGLVSLVLASSADETTSSSNMREGAADHG